MKLFFVVGTRPNLIKLSPILNTVKSYPELDIKVVHTGQHFDYNMSLVFFEELVMPKPNFFLEVDNSSHAKQTASIMVAFEELCLKEKPDGVVVFGDVNSTVAAALVAAKLNIFSFHIESGLRSFNRTMPEEINRLITDHICNVLYAPSQTAMNNLKNEGLTDRALCTGDIMYDAVKRNMVLAESKSDILKTLDLIPDQYYITTLHRPYNVDNEEVLKDIIAAFSEVKEQIVFAVHPRTYKNLSRFGITLPANIITTEPLGYFDFLLLQKNAKKIITDSGGIQKEAFFIHKPCITLRPETEWVETVQCKANILVKSRKKDDILKAIFENQEADFSQNVYGDGHSSVLILDSIEKTLLK